MKFEAGPPSLTWDINEQALHVPSLGAHKWNGPVEGNGQRLSGAVVAGSTITGAVDVASDGGLSCKGDLDVGGDGSVVGTLVSSSGRSFDTLAARVRTWLPLR